MKRGWVRALSGIGKDFDQQESKDEGWRDFKCVGRRPCCLWWLACTGTLTIQLKMRPVYAVAAMASNAENCDEVKRRCLREMRFIAGLRGMRLHLPESSFELMGRKDGLLMRG
jgi:hypothetical protein